MLLRRNALKILGALVVCLGGKATIEAKAEESLELSIDAWKPTSFTFSEEGITDIIIIRKDGTKITIPFSEIVEALTCNQ